MYFQIAVFEQPVDSQRVNLATVAFCLFLHHLTELDLQPARQGDVVIPLQYVGDTALAGLAVDTHHFFVPASDIERIDRQVGHVPDITLFAAGQTLANRVLMTAGERGEHQLARIRMARMSGNLGTGFHHFGNFRHAGQVQGRVDALGIQVHGHGYQVHVAGTLTVAHQGAFHPVRACHHAQFRGRHRTAPVVMGVQADADVLTVANVLANPLDLIGEHVRSRHLHRGWQVDNHRLALVGAPNVGYGVNHFCGKVQFGASEALRRILEGPDGLRVTSRDFLHQGSAIDGDLAYAVAVQAKHLLPLNRRGGVVHVYNRLLRAFQRLIGALDQFRAGLGEHLDFHIRWNAVFFNQFAAEIKVRLARRRETDFDFLEAKLDQQIEQTLLLGNGHRLDQGLVTIPQVNSTPGGSFFDNLVGPAAVFLGNRLEGNVFTMIKGHI